MKLHNCLKNYIIDSIYRVSIFNCKEIDTVDIELNNRIESLINYIEQKWRDENV